jgi:uncharacterized protein YecE (DUF72 family)
MTRNNQLSRKPPSFSDVIQIGTTGYAYRDWVGPFYPKGTTKKEMLRFYAKHFSVLEVVASYYSIPTRKAIDALISRGGPNMTFVLRAFREMLNPRTGGLEAARNFVKAVRPLATKGRLGALLLQLPWSMACTQLNRRYLEELGEVIDEFPIIVEFRNLSWDNEESYSFLEERGWGFCCTDQPRLKGLLPPSERVTARIGCVRFHGRNAEHWWKNEQLLRYDYLYSREELREWVPRLRRMAAKMDRLYVFAANRYQAQAVKTSRALRALLNS